jgi:hypothetical protein
VPGGADCSWYPNARLFRRSVPSGWSSAVDAILAELKGCAPILQLN